MAGSRCGQRSALRHGTAPMMQVDKTYHEQLTPEKVDQILAGLGKG
jgi:NADH:ubiquinone oxidoreductase subunit E